MLKRTATLSDATHLKRAIVFFVVASASCSDGDNHRAKAPNDQSLAKRAKDRDTETSAITRFEFNTIATRLEKSQNKFLGRGQIAMLRRKLEHPSLPEQAKAVLTFQLSWHHLRLGNIAEATREIERLDAMIQAHPNPPPAMLPMYHRHRAITYLRQAEFTNCIQSHNRDCCIFPLRDGGIHRKKDPATEARKSLLVKLGADSSDLESIWLLNLVSMAIGDYPDAVPAVFRIPPDAFQSDFDIKRFRDVAPELGVHSLDLCGGVIVDDFSGNGLLDIITSTYDPRGSLSYFQNVGDGQFNNATSAAHLDEQLGGLNCIGADYDNDGDVDILVLRGAWLFDDGRIRNSLLRNNNDGTFDDVTRAAGLADPARPTQAAVWGDFDADGDLDLFVGNESRTAALAGDGDYPSQLFRNNGDGTFTDIARQAGVTNDRYAKGVAAGDFDNDGDLDLYVSNGEKNRLYQNNGDGTFRDVAETLGVTEPNGVSFATWFFDYDNDGWLDLFVAAYECTLADIAADYLKQSHKGVSPRLYRNDQKGGFIDVTEQLGLDHPYLPMGANFGDLDYDGFLDIYLATGRPNFHVLVPNIMLRNNGGKQFQDVTTSGGFGHVQKGHGVAFADIDNDGDQDIYHQLGGFFPGDRFHNALFQNPGHGNRFVIVKLIGTTTNRSAVGARLRVTVDSPSGPRTVHRAVGCVSSFGGSPLRQEIGLGAAEGIRCIEIDWPRSHATQIVKEPPLDSLITITEGSEGFVQSDLTPIELK